MNLSRLEHSAKGHYPGLHVCWAAVLSNSTRCCCDHQVTCEGRVSICTPPFSPFIAASPSVRLYPRKTGRDIVGVERHLKNIFLKKAVKCREVCGKPSLTPVGILFGDRLWDGLMASKLQFNAQETGGCVLAPQGCVCVCVQLWGCCKQSRGGSHCVIFPWRGQSIATAGLKEKLSFLC